ncbi:MAG TPA: helix-turn-helix domain-containing protein [Candidatus Dormibacteraeota bacterium]|nr:helix-turn-helix domain-containing protein [Candidatus Dormibacteraeota bacterium]
MTTRDRIVEAAAGVMETQGLARATTKEIARAAHLSEAALYKHFRDKEEIFLTVLREQLPPFVETVKDLPARAGTATVEANLADLARVALPFYERTIPLSAALFAESELLLRHRNAVLEAGGGPHHGNRLVAEYLTAERDLGRLAPEADPAAAAMALLGACFQRAFLRRFVGPEAVAGDDGAFAEDLARTLARGLSA